MKGSLSVPAFLLLVLIVLRAHLSGAAYPFTQGLFLLPALIGLALVFLSPQADQYLKGRRLRLNLVLPWLLCGWSFVSVLWSADPGRGAEVSFALILGVTAFTLTFLLTRNSDGKERMWVYGICLLLLSVLAHSIYQYFFGISRLRAYLGEMEASGQNVADLMGIISKGRVFAAFLNSNMLAGFLAILIPLTLDFAITSRDRGCRLIYVVLTAGQFGVLVLTGSMGGSLAAAAAAAVVFLIRRGSRRRELLWMAVIGTMLVMGIVMVRGSSLRVGSDHSVIQRIGYMKAGILMAAEKPFVGWGPGSTPDALMGFVREGIRPVTDPHNFLIRSWIAWGLPGVVILLGFIFLWAKTVFGSIVGSGWRNAPPGLAGLALGSSAFLFHSLMDMDFSVPETAFYGWVVMGASLGMSTAMEKGEAVEGPTVGKGVLRVMAGTLLALVLPSFVFMQAEFTGLNADRAREDGRDKEAAELYRDARRLLPFHGRFALEEGRMQMTLGHRDEALELFSRAGVLLKHSPYPPWELGRASLEEEDWGGSIQHLEKALARYPTSPRIRLDLAQAYYELGDYPVTIRLLQEVKRYAIFDPEAMRVADEALQGRGIQEKNEPIQAY